MVLILYDLQDAFYDNESRLVTEVVMTCRPIHRLTKCLTVTATAVSSTKMLAKGNPSEGRTV